MSGNTPPTWLPDPFRRYEFRYWDGWRWTHHVSTRGHQAVDPPVVDSPPPPPVGGPTPVPAPHPPLPAQQSPPPPDPGASGSKKIQRQVARAGVAFEGPPGGGTLFTESVLVVNQKAKLIEVNAEYAVYNQNGHQVGAVRQVGQSVLRNAVSVTPKSSGKKTLQVVDANGHVLMTLTRPATVAKSTVIVRHPSGMEIGRLVQKTFGVIGKVRFDLIASGQVVGSLNADSWGAWDFNIKDATDAEIARITKNHSAFGSRRATKKDTYVVEIYQQTADPLRSLVVVAALAIDTALRQNHR